MTTCNSNTTETVGTHNVDANTAVYTISIGSLATALIISRVVFITVIIILLRKSKAKIKVALYLTEQENPHMYMMNQCMKMSLGNCLQSVSSAHKIMLPMVFPEQYLAHNTC